MSLKIPKEDIESQDHSEHFFYILMFFLEVQSFKISLESNFKQSSSLVFSYLQKVKEGGDPNI